MVLQRCPKGPVTRTFCMRQITAVVTCLQFSVEYYSTNLLLVYWTLFTMLNLMKNMPYNTGYSPFTYLPPLFLVTFQQVQYIILDNDQCTGYSLALVMSTCLLKPGLSSMPPDATPPYRHHDHDVFDAIIHGPQVNSYQDRATFVHLYGPEPHPIMPGTNFDRGSPIPNYWSTVIQQRNYEDRVKMAARIVNDTHPSQVQEFGGRWGARGESLQKRNICKSCNQTKQKMLINWFSVEYIALASPAKVMQLTFASCEYLSEVVPLRGHDTILAFVFFSKRNGSARHFET